MTKTLPTRRQSDGDAAVETCAAMIAMFLVFFGTRHAPTASKDSGERLDTVARTGRICAVLDGSAGPPSNDPSCSIDRAGRRLCEARNWTTARSCDLGGRGEVNRL